MCVYVCLGGVGCFSYQFVKYTMFLKVLPVGTGVATGVDVSMAVGIHVLHEVVSEELVIFQELEGLEELTGGSKEIKSLLVLRIV